MKVFNYSELHFSEGTSFKIHTLAKATWIQSMVFLDKKIEENKCSKNTEPISARIADNVVLIM